MNAQYRSRHMVARWVAGVVLAPLASLLLCTQAAVPVYPTAEAAAASLVDATRARDLTRLESIFGPKLGPQANPDRVQATNECAAFTDAFEQRHRIRRETPTRSFLEVGTHGWIFPIPLVHSQDGWTFDTHAGEEELLNRRIGRNELAALEVMRAYVDAQREYASRDRDGDEVLEYAQRLASSPGATDGLYWPVDFNDEISPLGPLVAAADGKGYQLGTRSEKSGPQPFEGYFFKILTQQGRQAPGGRYTYVINGNMIGGFAMVAWPAQYGQTGVMTFIVNQQGRVYQKDLGPKTGALARGMDSYNPDPSWHLSPD